MSSVRYIQMAKPLGPCRTDTVVISPIDFEQVYREGKESTSLCKHSMKLCVKNKSQRQGRQYHAALQGRERS